MMTHKGFNVFGDSTLKELHVYNPGPLARRSEKESQLKMSLEEERAKILLRAQRRGKKHIGTVEDAKEDIVFPGKRSRVRVIRR